jgi:xylose isomerase
MAIEYSIILSFMGQLKDRFSLYHQPRTVAERIARVSEVQGVTGVEMVYPDDFQDVGLVREALAQTGLRISTVNVNLKGDPRWHQGALTARDDATRREAVRWMQEGLDLAAEMGCNLVTMCPLADGHDYPFEVDYRLAWRSFVEGIRAAADHRPDVRLSLEYKRSEPRARVVIGNMSRALYACIDADRPNVGVTLDIGHALYAGESSAESIALLNDAGRLFLVHSNDNYRDWDWDLIPGTVNTWDLIESTYYLQRIGYAGWITFDVFPSRLDPVRTMQLSLSMHQYAEQVIEQVGADTIAAGIAAGDVIGTMSRLAPAMPAALSRA